MAISVDWGTKVIYVPQNFLTYLSGDRWQLDVNEFRLALKDLEDGDEGVVFPDTHQHNSEVTLSGVTYARTFTIINGYTVQFEDKGPHYTIVCAGANHNIGDVLVPGATHLVIGNSAGLIVVSGNEGMPTAVEIANAVWSKVLIGSTVTASQLMAVISAALAGKLSGANTSLVKIRDLEDTKDIITAAVDAVGNRLTVTLDL